MTYVIAQPCVDLKDKACIEECPVDCIYEGERIALHPPGRVRRLRRLRAGLPGRGDLLRGRRARAVEGLLQGERRVLRRPRLARRCRQARPDRQGPPADRRAAAAGARTERRLAPASPATSARRAAGLPLGHARPVRRAAPGPIPAGIVDLSVGTPVDPTPPVVRDALAAAADAPGYPQTYGTPALREAVAAWFARRRGVPDVDPAGVLPTIGSKELVAWLPTLLGLGPGDLVVHPEIAYPTYDVGARLAGATPVAGRRHGAARSAGPRRVRLVWLNSPSQPHRPGARRRAPGQGRRLGPVSTASSSPATSATPSWAGTPGTRPAPSRACSTRGSAAATPRGAARRLLAVQAVEPGRLPRRLRRRRPGAGRARLLEVRKHAGMIVPWPVQAAHARGARATTTHVAEQRERYRRPARRSLPRRPGRRRLPRRPLARPGSTCGPPGTSRAGTRSAGWPSAASSSRPATSTDPARRPARAGRADRDRRRRRQARRPALLRGPAGPSMGGPVWPAAGPRRRRSPAAAAPYLRVALTSSRPRISSAAGPTTPACSTGTRP